MKFEIIPYRVYNQGMKVNKNQQNITNLQTGNRKQETGNRKQETGKTGEKFHNVKQLSNQKRLELKNQELLARSQPTPLSKRSVSGNRFFAWFQKTFTKTSYDVTKPVHLPKSDSQLLSVVINEQIQERLKQEPWLIKAYLENPNDNSLLDSVMNDLKQIELLKKGNGDMRFSDERMKKAIVQNINHIAVQELGFTKEQVNGGKHLNHELHKALKNLKSGKSEDFTAVINLLENSDLSQIDAEAFMNVIKENIKEKNAEAYATIAKHFLEKLVLEGDLDNLSNDKTPSDFQKKCLLNYEQGLNALKAISFKDKSQKITHLKDLNTVFKKMDQRLDVQAAKEILFAEEFKLLSNEISKLVENYVDDKDKKMDLDVFFTINSSSIKSNIYKKIIENNNDLSNNVKKLFGEKVVHALIDRHVCNKAKSELGYSDRELKFYNSIENSDLINEQLSDIKEQTDSLNFLDKFATSSLEKLNIGMLKKQLQGKTKLKEIQIRSLSLLLKNLMNDYVNKYQSILLNPEEGNIQHEEILKQFLEASDLLQTLAKNKHCPQDVKDSFDVIKGSIPGIEKKLNNIQEKRLNNLIKSKESGKLSNGLTPMQDEAFTLLSQHKSSCSDEIGYSSLTKQEKIFLSKFLELSIDNPKINKAFRVFQSKYCSKTKDLERSETVQFIAYFSYKTKGVNKIDTLNTKLENALGSIEKNENVSKENKLKFTEYGSLSKFGNLAEQILFIKESSTKGTPSGIVEEGGKLDQMFKSIEKANNLTKKVEEKFKSQSTFGSKDILMNDIDRKYKFKGDIIKGESWKTKFFVSQYGHAGKIYNEKGKTKISEISTKHDVIKLNFEETTYSDVYRIHPHKMVSKEMGEKLKLVFGEDWPKKVDELYENIETQLHKNNQKNFKGIKNNVDRRYSAGKADYGLEGGHFRKKDRDFRKIHDKIYLKEDQNQEKSEKKMICSEFVAKTTIAAFVELNDQLHNLIGQELEKVPNEEMKNGLKKQFITEDNKPVEIVKVPFNKRERLKRIHPGRLIKNLQSAGCIEKLPPSPLHQQLISN